ncbi:hypothetical protein VTK73DRAFT_609 [Phialemonium thermophilum]|uniref:Uncharacterized protein n=1 Tax=Phialemonium thermophilum TaxID=223376 RepID=A0ABR3XEF0_9PEZI
MNVERQPGPMKSRQVNRPTMSSALIGWSASDCAITFGGCWLLVNNAEFIPVLNPEWLAIIYFNPPCIFADALQGNKCLPMVVCQHPSGRGREIGFFCVTVGNWRGLQQVRMRHPSTCHAYSPLEMQWEGPVEKI